MDAGHVKLCTLHALNLSLTYKASVVVVMKSRLDGTCNLNAKDDSIRHHTGAY